MEKIKITQVKSPINRTKKQKLTLLALGLRKIGMTVEHDRTPNILGMVKKVSHLITVENFISITTKRYNESPLVM